jgi:hypothetical protein
MARFCIKYDVQAGWKMNGKVTTLGQVEDETRLTAV